MEDLRTDLRLKIVNGMIELLGEKGAVIVIKDAMSQSADICIGTRFDNAIADYIRQFNPHLTLDLLQKTP